MTNVTNSSSIDSVNFTPHFVQAAQYTGAAVSMCYAFAKLVVVTEVADNLISYDGSDTCPNPSNPQAYQSSLHKFHVNCVVVAACGVLGGGIGRLVGWAGYHTARAIDCAIDSLSKHFKPAPLPDTESEAD